VMATVCLSFQPDDCKSEIVRPFALQMLAVDNTSKCQSQRELFVGSYNNELRKGLFIRSRSNRIQLGSTRRPHDSQTASRRAAACRAARHKTSVPCEKLLYLGWAKLSHRATAIPVHQGSILTGNTPGFSRDFRSVLESNNAGGWNLTCVASTIANAPLRFAGDTPATTLTSKCG
jgi:hypothetical protein